MSDDFPIEINKNGRFTYINEVTGERWSEWKKWDDLTDEEKQKVNLGQYSPKYILLDFDFKNKSEQEIKDAYNEWERNFVYTSEHTHWIADRSPHGFHIYLPFDNLHILEEDIQNELRKIYVEHFKADKAKISINGIVSLPGRPHFKVNKILPILNTTTQYNHIAETKINIAKTRVQENKEKIRLANKDMNFENFFEEDPFFKYISTNIIPDGTGRDMNIFPNLAIACSKTGKSKDEIDKIMKPIINNNFPGKNYAEFEGWLKKAIDGRIDTFNKYQLNTWIKENTNNQENIYDVSPGIVPPETVQQLKDPKKELRNRFMTDEQLENLQEKNISWLIDKWLALGDINFVAGKAASYKTTAVLHMAYCIATGKKVFNEYDVIKSPVLYLNEENSTPIFKKMIRRIKAGLELTGAVPNMHHSILESWRLDQADECQLIIDYINQNGIKLLVCDSFRRFFDFEENSATDINKLFNNVKILRESCKDLTIIILHHVKKSQQGSSGDTRDSLRGSSDIVNSADSIIGITRKRNNDSFVISHIKNRAGQEMENKLIMINCGDNDEKAYLYQSDQILTDEAHTKSVHEKRADEILKYLEDHNIRAFKRQDLQHFEDESSKGTVLRALKTLLEEGSIRGGGRGQSAVYQVMSLNQTETFSETEKLSEETKDKKDKKSAPKTSEANNSSVQKKL